MHKSTIAIFIIILGGNGHLFAQFPGSASVAFPKIHCPMNISEQNLCDQYKKNKRDTYNKIAKSIKRKLSFGGWGHALLILI